ncbi:nitroreductase family deazaflavin-dependent oxidoreductase [Pseudonocardia nigra]|uniref:nitroreductase family deazaflavin-dependent oxidoreductase n=1 Tax=Pseudonocardia nigra TaxID=1921578 RepID=UPI001C5F8BF0|nr:nitroreductase family deazaflavin-dependent oxidoreductase [Pseudonocardia nigra]
MTTPNDCNQKIIDEFRANEGRVGGMFEGARMILIHHIGAKSGVERVVPLVWFPHDDGQMAIIASAGGAPNHPAWYHNLRANPKIDVEVGAETLPVVATEVEGEERDAIWQRVVAAAPGFAEYQQKTTRTIPVFVLSRLG